jgi:hypothetical protein
MHSFSGLLQARLAALYGEPFCGADPEATFREMCRYAYGCLDGLSDKRNGERLPKSSRKSLLEKWITEALKKCLKLQKERDMKK